MTPPRRAASLIRIASEMLKIFEGALPDLASAQAAKFQISQRESLHQLRDGLPRDPRSACGGARRGRGGNAKDGRGGAVSQLLANARFLGEKALEEILRPPPPVDYSD